MKIYLINSETNEIMQIFENVIHWGVDFVEFNNNGYRGKVYCDYETSVFTDQEPMIKEGINE